MGETDSENIFTLKESIKMQEWFNFIMAMATLILAITSILTTMKIYELIITPLIWIFIATISIIAFVIIIFILARIPSHHKH
ncbi:MAG: hypothetical protein AABX99_03780 [Nanoarchaeota archaeon]